MEKATVDAVREAGWQKRFNTAVRNIIDLKHSIEKDQFKLAMAIYELEATGDWKHLGRSFSAVLYAKTGIRGVVQYEEMKAGIEIVGAKRALQLGLEPLRRVAMIGYSNTKLLKEKEGKREEFADRCVAVLGAFTLEHGFRPSKTRGKQLIDRAARSVGLDLPKPDVRKLHPVDAEAILRKIVGTKSIQRAHTIAREALRSLGHKDV